jgi:hypothetical protein
MKNLFIVLIALFTSFQANAKKVKFACDMTGITIMPAGMHISGDFQTLAGFPGGDWNSASTPLTQEPGTDIYSIVVDIPAFAKYEYKFVNGDQFYEVEFVPEYSRVGYNFNDNRWIYIDSLANDTTFVGAIIFGGNAPAGMKLVRFYVDMNSFPVAASGVHVAGDWQGWNTSSTIMYSFGGSLYEMICYMPVGTYEYLFYNGNTSGTNENLTGSCIVNGHREVTVVDDMLMGYVCFASCDPCLTGIAEYNPAIKIRCMPNPSAEKSLVEFGNHLENATLTLLDISGRVVRRYSNVSGSRFTIERTGLQSGVYLVMLNTESSIPATERLIFR